MDSNRPEVVFDEILVGIDKLKVKLFKRLQKKGHGAYVSRHEILGIITEEYLEAVEAVRDNSEQGYDDYKEELMDIAVGALFGFICMDVGHIRHRKE